MSDFENDSSEETEEYSDEDEVLREDLASGKLKPGLNQIVSAPKQFVNNIKGLEHKCEEMKLKLPWIERLDSINKEAPLAPELAAKMLEQEQRRENQLKNNKKLPQFAPSEDPVLNDFKRELVFHRQAQATVLHAFPILKSMNIATLRPDDYFAEMAKSDTHMQKVRENLMQKQAQQQRSERVKELRNQRKEGKAIQIQTKLQRMKEKKEMLDQVKKVRKGVSKDLSFLDSKKGGPSKKSVQKRTMRDKKFGFGGRKRGSKTNTKESSADVSEYDGHKGGKGGKGGKNKFVKNRKGDRSNNKQTRPGKNRRVQMKGKGRK